MVPQKPDDIPAAMAAKLATLDALLDADGRSLGPIEDEGRRLIDALRRAAADLNEELRDAATSPPPGNPR